MLSPQTGEKMSAPKSFDSDVRPHELAHIAQSRQEAGLPPVGPGQPLAALALSGGGIRSATFNLGLIQALAQAGKLRRFDYLSTVSGGGYIGGWLTAWIHRRGLDAVEAQLASSVNGLGSEPREIRWLRAHSNYLTPRKGLLSLDTLWGGCTYVRNLVINQFLLIAVINAMLVTGALFHVELAIYGARYPFGLAVAGTLVLLASAPVVGFEFAHLRGQAPRPFARKLVCWLRGGSAHWIVAFLMVTGASMLAYAFALGPDRIAPEGAMAAFAGLVFAAYWLLAALSVVIACGGADDPILANTARPEKKWLLWLLLGSLLFGFLVDSYAASFPEVATHYPWLVPLLGPVLYVAAMEVGTLALILLAGRSLRAFAHDWLSRLAALILSISVLPMVVFTSWVLLAPTIDYLATMAEIVLSTVTAAWILSTVFGVLGGKNAATGSPASNRWVERLLAATPYIFALGLFTLLVWCSREILLWISGAQDNPFEAKSALSWLGAVRINLQMLVRIPDFVWVAAALVLLFVAVILAWRVDINLFSFHSYYRNRLAHAYLGASAERRKANAFTGYAPEDSPMLEDLDRTKTDQNLRPYPLINTALNMGGAPRMEWQQRKAAAFVFSPLYCGFELPPPLTDNRDAAECGGSTDPGLPICAHRLTGDFIKAKRGRQIGHSLAIAISGAAASPNMGYHTSPALAALMTAFNVRLGWWMPNPRFAGPWAEGGPDFSSGWMLKELAASATAEDAFVYLSDGGHFENLGVYEALRRRCKLVVASDASADPPFHFGDLASLVHKARADLGIEIDANTAAIRPDIAAGGVIGSSKSNHIIARIVYPPEPGAHAVEIGWLVYLKSSLPAALPADIENYRRTRPGFPHQSTADQWFDESQFEAYRRLGLELGRIVIGEMAKAELNPALGW
jgi:patatin-like phospholipase